MTNNQQTPGAFKRILPVIAIGVIFLLPVLLAWIVYLWLPSHVLPTKYHGELLDNPQMMKQYAFLDDHGLPLDKQFFAKKWTLMMPLTTPCEAACKHSLYLLRQVRLALGKDMKRVQRVIVSPSDRSVPNLAALITERFSGTIHVQLSPDALSRLQKVDRGGIYLVDPRGVMILRYDAKIEPKGLYKDLRRLLRLSAQG